MKLVDLNPTVRQLTTEFYELEIDCPTCRKYRIPITFRVGQPKQEPPHAWGASSIDPERMSLVPSVSNAQHGRIRCSTHVIVSKGTVEFR